MVHLSPPPWTRKAPPPPPPPLYHIHLQPSDHHNHHHTQSAFRLNDYDYYFYYYYYHYHYSRTHRLFSYHLPRNTHLSSLITEYSIYPIPNTPQSSLTHHQLPRSLCVAYVLCFLNREPFPRPSTANTARSITAHPVPVLVPRPVPRLALSPKSLKSLVSRLKSQVYRIPTGIHSCLLGANLELFHGSRWIPTQYRAVLAPTYYNPLLTLS